MPLVESIPGQRSVEYKDDEWLLTSRFARKQLGIAVTTLHGAITFSGARSLVLPDPRGQSFFLVGDLPKVINWLANSTNTAFYPYHHWARVKDPKDFETKTPSGATIRYTQEPKVEQKDPAELYSLKEHEVVFQRQSLPEGYVEMNPLDDKGNERRVLRDPEVDRVARQLREKYGLIRGVKCRTTALRDPQTGFPQRGIALIVTNLSTVWKNGKQIWPPDRY